MKFKTFFDKAYCINLDRRPDRWNSSQEEFNKVNIKVKRFSAVDGTLYPQLGDLKLGANGCRLSHFKLINLAKNKNYNSIFITEDDIVFDDNFNEKFDSISSNIPENWDFIYLAANPFCGERKKVADGVYRMTGGYSSHSIVMKNTVFDAAIDAISNNYIQVDVVYAMLQERFNCYVTIPHLAFQRNGFSDVENLDVNYDFFRN